MEDMAVTTQQDTFPVLASDSMFFDVAKFEHAQRVATMLSTSTIVPEHFRKNLGNCIIALNLAERMRVDPFMLMQTMYVIHGKPGIEGKLAIALINGSKKFTPLQYKKTGDENTDERTYVAHATHQETGEDCEGPAVSIGMAKAEGWHDKNGSKWKTMPELMLAYRSAMFFARTYCPEVLLGLQTKDEIHDTYVDMHQNSSGAFVAEPTEKATYTAKKVETNEEPLEVDMATENNMGPDTQEEKTIRDEFINLRTAGFSTWVFKNKDRLKNAPEGIQEEAGQKWKGLYSEPWPLESNPEDPPAQDEGQDSFVFDVNQYRDIIGDGDVNEILRIFGDVENGEPVSVPPVKRDAVLQNLKAQADTKLEHSEI